jgi:hypothetical protein
MINQMRDDHIQDILDEKKMNLQIADIQIDSLTDNVNDLSEMREDIASNIS